MIVGPKRVVFMDGPCLAGLVSTVKLQRWQAEAELKRCCCTCRDLYWVGQQHNFSNREVHPQLLAHYEGAALLVPDRHVPANEAASAKRLAYDRARC